jgi:glycosyltransferase involved in cell wall biosynthesis
MLQMRLWRRWWGAIDRIIAISDAVRDRLEDGGLEVSSVVRPGVPIRSARPPLSTPPTVAYAGRLVREKGVDVLLRAFAPVASRAADARLLIAGDGPERGLLERLAAELAIAPRVRFVGHLARRELESLLDGAWVQAVPSLWAEPFGLVGAEAMMRGTAVVASDTGGLTEFIRDGETGLLVPPGDVEALAGALGGLLLEPGRAERVGAAGRADALAHLDSEHFVDQFVRIYEELAGAAPRRTGWDRPVARPVHRPAVEGGDG